MRFEISILLAAILLSSFCECSRTVECVYANLAIKHCSLYVGIDEEGTEISNARDETVGKFYSNGVRGIRFLPKSPAEKFPKMIEYKVLLSSVQTIKYSNFKGLFELKDIDLGYNKIHTIEPDTFTDQTKLDVLDIRSNQIRSLDPEIFKPLVNLRILQMSENLVEFIDPKTFEALINIRSFYIDSNKLKSIDKNTFARNVNLSKLWIAGNDLTELDPLFLKNNVNVGELKLSGNSFKSIPLDIFENLKKLEEVNLDDAGCIDDSYRKSNFEEMKAELRQNCSPGNKS